jgi:hypothetical protein
MPSACPHHKNAVVRRRDFETEYPRERPSQGKRVLK